MLEPRKVSPRRSFASVITGFGAILTVVLVPMTALAAPGNDSFHQPQRITSIPFTTTQSTEGATSELDEPFPSCAPIANTVWFRFRSTTNQELNANTYGSDFDTVISVYAGTTYPLPAAAAGNDDDSDCGDAGNLTSITPAFPVTAGQHYRVAVDGYKITSNATPVTHGNVRVMDMLPVILEG